MSRRVVNQGVNTNGNRWTSYNNGGYSYNNAATDSYAGSNYYNPSGTVVLFN